MKGNLICPKCGHKQGMIIPAKKCIPFYKCSSCKKIIVAKKNCCVFCDYGDRKCPVSSKHKGGLKK